MATTTCSRPTRWKWQSPPFQPQVRNDRLYARGVSDDKGPMLIPIKTAEAFLKTAGKLPINLKLVIEGEEERGSAHLGAFVAATAGRLAPTSCCRPTARCGGPTSPPSPSPIAASARWSSP